MHQLPQTGYLRLPQIIGDAYRGMMATFKKIDARFDEIARDLNI